MYEWDGHIFCSGRHQNTTELFFFNQEWKQKFISLARVAIFHSLPELGQKYASLLLFFSVQQREGISFNG